jgi:hypothetical protein
MFIAYKNIVYLGEKDGKHTWEYEIADSEFGTVSGTNCGGIYIVGLGVAIIQEYSKRNLNVAANLAVAFVWYNKQYYYWSLQQLIDYNKQYNHLFQQYEKDLQKYLILI